MSNMEVYLNYIKTNGYPLNAINLGSDELALSVNDALQAIELLKRVSTAVLGGGILTCNSEGLIYSYKSWGAEYHFLNWYCYKLEE